MKRVDIILVALLTLPIVANTQALTSTRNASPTQFGITSFPYDTTLEAIENVRRIVTDNSTLAAIHLDNGIPWREILDGAPLPPSIRGDWAERVAAIPHGRPVHVGLAPLDTDRKSLAPALGEKGRIPLPDELTATDLDDPKVISAYSRYVRLAIATFHPTYLNIGIEAGEIMSRDIL